MSYTLDITMRDGAGVQQALDSCIFAARTSGRVAYVVKRRGGGQVTFTLSGSRRDVRKVNDVGTQTRLW